MKDWMIGQRCASLGEPTLGLGIIRKIENRNVFVHFPAVNTERIYAKDKAPLRRVTFEPGEMVTSSNGDKFQVVEVREQNGILIYVGDNEILPELSLDNGIVYSRPDQQLLAGHLYKPVEFDLRVDAWKLKERSLGSEVRGLVGPRIQLLSHQLFIAEEVSKRPNPRVLLSDEVGLGKTIEAGLIFHKLWMSGEVKRVLILTPSTLVHQWLTELYRKFNVLFNIMTAEHALELKQTHPELNPYLAHQCIIQNIHETVENENLRESLLKSYWDLLIVDEAQHLQWSSDAPSIAYSIVETLSVNSGGVLLLTATPRQLGLESHFSRLKILDPERFHDFEGFVKEADRYQAIAKLTDSILEGDFKNLKKEILELFPNDPFLLDLLPKQIESLDKETLIRALVDRHGTGRIVFRNRRNVMAGFPKRLVHPIWLESDSIYSEILEIFKKQDLTISLAQKVLAGLPAIPKEHLPKRMTISLQKKSWQKDPRLLWLVPFLKKNSATKFLLLCSHKNIVLALQNHLAQVPDLDVAYFYEELSILERDRQAAYFAHQGGAQILICSEIGSEGRNFQFVNHLILFDLPLNPALLEQRIGRLDRIGQHRDINLIIPIPKASPLENVFRWYQEALDAFSQPMQEGDFLFEKLHSGIPSFFNDDQDKVNQFIEESRESLHSLRTTLEQGRDKLLERHSFNPLVGEKIASQILSIDQDSKLKIFMDAVFDIFGVYTEDQISTPSQILRPSPHMLVSQLPGLPEEGLETTYDRNLATQREDLTFLSIDHPMVISTLEMFLNLDRGVTSFSIWKNAPNPGILVQSLWILECLGAGELGLERFLPPQPILLTMDQNQVFQPALQEQLQQIKLEKGPLVTLHQQRNALADILASLLEKSQEEAKVLAQKTLKKARNIARKSIGLELERLEALSYINPGITPKELTKLREQKASIDSQLKISQTRLDAVRMILMVP